MNTTGKGRGETKKHLAPRSGLRWKADRKTWGQLEQTAKCRQHLRAVIDGVCYRRSERPNQSIPIHPMRD